MSDQVVLAIHNGGLGDSLIYSTLPELWVREHGVQVSITTCNFPFRNEGIPDLVWKTNPYVTEILPHNHPFTHVIEIGNKLDTLILKYGNNIMAHEAFFGFEPTNKYPRLYWQPGYNHALRGKVIIDASGVTMPFNKEAFEPYVNWLQDHDMFQREDMLMLDTGKGTLDSQIFPNIPRYVPKDIYDYARTINSCKIFLTSESGGAALASAIKGANPYPKIIAVMSTFTHNRGTWVWGNIEYFYTGKLTFDF